ncbi:AI-2E family transporter [Nodosilinea sp. PGN35]|uniref:AI-2E family transporter n=1 Tax=Nodosilinea sp. PGN35 TaxID=3020489 RepID=UPI0023B2738B|nr:AI-2E family transporter [Nodosilinea sp. TSF1-S3]MDF0369988.1 AI-2E family transporter [Nodosilinea sp. TSF1-S3]
MAKSNGLELQRVLLVAAAIALWVAIGMLLWAIINVFFMLFLGVLLAIVLRFAAGLVQRYTAIPHPWSLGVVLLVGLGLLAISMVLLVPAVVTQFEQLLEQIGGASNQLQDFLTQGPWSDHIPADILEELSEPARNPNVQRTINQLTAAFSEGFSILANVLFIVFTGLFLAIDPQRYRASLVRLVPPRGRHRANQVLHQVLHGLKLWLVGRVLSMVLIALVITVGLQLMGVPFALALGVLTGLFEFIPVVGPLLSAVPGILMAFTVGPMKALYVAAFFLVVQQLEGNVMTPIVQMKTASLPPVLTLTAVVAMGILFGPLGVLVATPLALVGMILVQELYIHDLLERQTKEIPAKDGIPR